MSRKTRLLATIPAVALLGATLTAPTAQASSVARYEPGPSDFYINYAPPRDEATPEEPGAPGGDKRSRSRAREIDQKHSLGNPAAARVLAAREQEALRTGRNPADFIFKKTKQTRTAKLLTLLVEFNENADDDFSGYNRLRTVDSAPTTASSSRPARSRTAPCTTTSRTRPRCRTRTTTPSGSRTSAPSTSTRCSTPTRASPSAYART
ncbi:hypothetical protein ACFQE7_41930 [Nonomuraea ferruginea]|uniref:hypothetical protein n=1 Tax=Nonomuraea ferruginea TaxID=46174 RepID=UPI00360EF50F